MPTKNLHWLIKAQLAERGGRKSHVRIAPDAVPGYIAALRGTNSVGDGGNKREGILIWKPKNATGKVQKTDGDSNIAPFNFTNPAVGPVPSDFRDVGFAALEHDLNSLVSGSDARTVPLDPESFIPWHDRPTLTDRQLCLESRRHQHQPQLHAEIESCAMFQMGKSGMDFCKDSLVEALTLLTKQGSPKQRLLASESIAAIAASEMA